VVLGESVGGGWGGGGEGGGVVVAVQTRLRPLGAQPCSIQTQEIGILTLQLGRGFKSGLLLQHNRRPFWGFVGALILGSSCIPPSQNKSGGGVGGPTLLGGIVGNLITWNPSRWLLDTPDK
jgi:hypothetical protein